MHQNRIHSCAESSSSRPAVFASITAKPRSSSASVRRARWLAAALGLLDLGLLAWFLSLMYFDRHVRRPLRKLDEGLARLAERSFDVVVTARTVHEGKAADGSISVREYAHLVAAADT